MFGGRGRINDKTHNTNAEKPTTAKAVMLSRRPHETLARGLTDRLTN